MSETVSNGSISSLVSAVVGALFKAEHRRIDNWLTEINEANNGYLGYRSPGFVYQGVTYVPYGQQDAARVTNKAGLLPGLAFELNDDVQAMVRDYKQVNLDRDQIRQMIFMLVTDCTSMQGIRDALPDCLAPYLEVWNMPRRRSQEDEVHFTDLKRRQYLKILPKIEMYCASRLLY